jgi:hypothetical protein
LTRALPIIQDHAYLQYANLGIAFRNGAIVRHTILVGNKRSRLATLYKLDADGTPIYRCILRTLSEQAPGRKLIGEHDQYAGIAAPPAITAFDTAVKRIGDKHAQDEIPPNLHDTARLGGAIRMLGDFLQAENRDPLMHELFRVVWQQLEKRLGLRGIGEWPAQLAYRPLKTLPPEIWPLLHSLIGSPIRIHRLEAAWTQHELACARAARVRVGRRQNQRPGL